MRRFTVVLLTIFALVLGAAGGWLGHGYYQDTQNEVAGEAAQDQTSESEDDTGSNKLLFTNVYRGEGTRNSYADNPSEPVALLVNSQTELDNIWPAMFAGELPPPKPVVDFDEQSILIAMLARKPTDGYMGTISSLIREGGLLSVQLEEKSPGNACRTSQTPTRPVHVVAVAKAEDSVRIELSHSNAAPCALPL